MTEEGQYIKFRDVERFLNLTYNCIAGGREIDLEKYGPYVDVAKCLLVPSLERRILEGLELFVYNENFHLSEQFPYLRRCIGTATNWRATMDALFARYRNVNVTSELTRHLMDLLTGEAMADCVIDSLVLNNRLNKICRELDSLDLDRNLLGYLNVWNYISEKDYWIRTDRLRTLPPSVVNPNPNDNLFSDLEVEAGSYNFNSRSRKRPATHVCKKSVKIERHLHLPEKTFKINDNLYTMLKNSSNIFDSVHSGRRVIRNGADLNRPSCFSYRSRHPNSEWKDEVLMLRVRKMYPTEFKVIKVTRPKNCKLTCYLTLPCKFENLISKISKIDASFSKSNSYLTQKRFETKMYNVCSCLNNLLSRMNGTIIRSICLHCEVRPNYIFFKLKPIAPCKSNVSLFAARVVTCQDLHKRSIRRENVGEGSRSHNFWASWMAQNMVKRLGDAPWTAYSGVQTVSSEDNFYGNEVEIASSDLSIGSYEDIPEIDKVKDVARGSYSRFGNLSIRSSIGRVLQKLEMSPFKCHGENHSIRSKIREILNLMLISKKENVFGERGRRRSISIQAIMPSASSRSVNIELVPVESKISMESNVTRVISFIETRIIKSTESVRGAASIKSMRSNESKGSDKSKGSMKSVGSLKSRGCAKPVESETLNPCVMTAFCDAVGNYPLTEVDRNGILMSKSAKAVRFGSNDSKNFPNESKVFASCTEYGNLTRNKKRISQICDNFTTMNKSMNSNNFLQESFSMKSIDRIKHLLKTKLCKKMLEFESDRSSTNTPKTVLSNEKYFLSIPSEKTSRNRSRNDLTGTTTDSVDSEFMRSWDASQHSGKSIPSDDRDSIKRRSNAYHSDREDYTRSNEQRKCGGCDNLSKSRCFDQIAENLRYAYESAKSLRSGMDSRRANVARNTNLWNNNDKACVNLFTSEQSSDYSIDSIDDPDFTPGEETLKWVRDNRESRNKLPATSFHNRNNKSRACSHHSVPNANATCNRDTRDQNSKSRYSKGQNRYACDKENRGYVHSIFPNGKITPIDSKSDFLRPRRGEYRTHGTTGSRATIRNSRNSRDPKSNYRLNLLERGNLYVRSNFGNLNFKDKYRERFDHIDRDFRSKLSQYVDLCKNVRYNLLKKLCPDDIYKASRTSIPCRDRYK